jgi:DNA-binding FadR family transcriptional regulator
VITSSAAPEPLATGAPEPAPGEAGDDAAVLRAPNARRTEKVSEVIAREIVRDSRGLEPGTMLPREAKLLERYQVGRASLREALRLLEVQGLIVIRPGPGGGPMIAQADSEHFGRMASLYFHMSGATYRDTLDARLIIEPVVVGIIAERQHAEDLEVLGEYLASSETTGVGMDEEEPAQIFAAAHDEERALEFHSMLMGMAGNPVVTLMAQSLQSLRASTRSESAFAYEGHREVTLVHDEIARAILDGDRGRAEQLMRDHMTEFVKHAFEVDPEYLEQVVSWH